MNIKKQLMAGFTLSLICSLGFAKVSSEEAAKLGNELTPMGAVKAGNKAGTISAWENGVVTQNADGTYKDPYAKEKPLFVITAKNMAEHKDKLSPGMQAMLKMYPETYKVPVYPTHRPVEFSQDIYGKAKKNATSAELVDGGNGITGFDELAPFPIPKSGIEVIWNHLTRYKGGSYESHSMQAVVQPNGAFIPVRLHDYWVAPYGLEEGFDAEKDDNILFYFMRRALTPARMTGNVLLVHETMDQVREARRAWGYNAGQRRVRRAPTVAYDGPGFAAEGTRTADNADMYNGAPDRYEWKLIGKKEMYVPYNSYKLADKKLKYDDIINKGHIDQDLTRYELHRVWQVEATLRDGARHIYAKRVFYIDEDSWQAVLLDHYDARGNLWRVAEGHLTYNSNEKLTNMAGEMLYDLQSGRYIAMNLTNEEKVGYNYSYVTKRRTFTPSALRRAGK